MHKKLVLKAEHNIQTLLCFLARQEGHIEMTFYWFHSYFSASKISAWTAEQSVVISRNDHIKFVE